MGFWLSPKIKESLKVFKYCKFKETPKQLLHEEGMDEESIKALEEIKVTKAAFKKATILTLDGEYDIKRMKQLFYSQFYLF